MTINSIIQNTSSEAKEAAFMMTQYERFGTVGRDEYIKYYIDEILDIDISMLSDYNEYLSEDSRYDDEIMTWDDLEDYLSGLKPLEVFRLASFSQYSFNDNYFRFNGYGNLVGMEEYQVTKRMKDDRDFLTWYVENRCDLDENEIEEAVNYCNVVYLHRDPADYYTDYTDDTDTEQPLTVTACNAIPKAAHTATTPKGAR